jgi:hypothetical protein
VAQITQKLSTIRIPLAFGNVARHGNPGAAHLIGKAVDLPARKNFSREINHIDQVHCFAPYEQIFVMAAHFASHQNGSV